MGIANKDGDTKIRKRAVYALEDLPDNEGIPSLIDIAKINQKVTVQKAAFVALETAMTRAPSLVLTSFFAMSYHLS